MSGTFFSERGVSEESHRVDVPCFVDEEVKIENMTERDEDKHKLHDYKWRSQRLLKIC